MTDAPEPTDGREPGGARSPGRAGTRLRDLVGALLVLGLIIAAMLMFSRGCSFSPGGPSIDPGSAPSVDVSAELGKVARTAGFPVRRPALPDGWRGNSSSASAVGSGAGAGVVIRVGWLTPGGRFMQLSQSNGALPEVVGAETGGPGNDAVGQVEVDGQRWATHPARRDEQAWATQVDDVVLVITGNGTPEEFQTLAGAVVAAPPLPTAS